MKFEEIVNWLYGFQKYGMKLGLDRIKFLSKKLGNPHKNYKIIHVGGTNGKGSVCRLLESILSKNGYTVGVYTSPHLQHLSERITVNGCRISEEDLISIVKEVKPFVDELISKGDEPTFFEVITAISFVYFSKKKVDFAVVEVGLGGNFDATNIVNPIISVITNVSLEHQQVLGNEIKDIAFEKSGIIKHGVPCVTAAKNEALDVIKKIVTEKKTLLDVVDKNKWTILKENIDGQILLIHGIFEDYPLKTSLLGENQCENISIAVTVAEILQMMGIYISKNSIVDGVAETVNPGRLELVNHEPFILLDGAHNVAGMKYLRESVERIFEYDRLLIVVGILSDKNIEDMLRIIAPLSEMIIVTKSSNIRACDPFKLKEILEKLSFKNKIVVKDKISDAVDYAKTVASKNDLIVVTGSLFTVGEARDHLGLY